MVASLFFKVTECKKLAQQGAGQEEAGLGPLSVMVAEFPASKKKKNPNQQMFMCGKPS